MGHLPDQQGSEKTYLPVELLYAGLRWVVAFSVFMMMTLTFIDVVGRYVFNRPLSGAYEVCGFLLGLVVFAGTSVVTKDRAHICVSLFNNLTGPVACARRILVAAWTGGSLALLAFLMWRLGMRIAAQHSRLPAECLHLRLPLWLAGQAEV